MTENNQNNAPVAADFIQYVTEGIVDFTSYVGDKEDNSSQLKVTFVTLPDSKVGDLIDKTDGKNIKTNSLYLLDKIKYVAKTGKNEEASFDYYITDSDNSKSDEKTVTINPTSDQKTDTGSQLIGTENNDILIADSYKGYHIWGAGGNDILVGNAGENIFVIDNGGTKINKTVTTIVNFEVSEDKIDLSQLTCVQSINDINIDSKSNNSQITFKNTEFYPQEILIEKTIPTGIAENSMEIFIFNNNQNEIENQCANGFSKDNGFLKDIVSSKYSWLSGGYVVGMLTMKLISCICSRHEKTTDMNLNIPNSDRSIATQLSNLNKSYYSDHVPIGITFQNGGEIELIGLKDSNTYFRYDGVISKTSWVGKNDGILFYNYNDNIKYADHKNIVMTEWSEDAKTDFEVVLEVFDTNKDQIFDDKDDKFNDFYIWQDKNSNGNVEDGELRSLKDLGIKAFNFNDSKIASDEQQEQGILNVATIEWNDGKVTNAYDLVFTAEQIVI